MSDLPVNPIVKDFLGRQIKVGDRVVWPGRQSSSLWMNEGVVLSLDWRDPPSWMHDQKKIPRIYVNRKQDKYDGGGWKKTFIDVIERVVVVSKEEHD